MIWRKAGISAVMAATVVALSGCVVFMSPPTAKRKHNTVTITVKGCASQSSGSPSGSCTNQGNAGENAPGGTGIKDQVFLGFLVPTSSKAPKSFSAKTGPVSGGPVLKFTPSKSYTSQLQAAESSSGMRWVGYWTRYFKYSDTSGQQNFTAKVPFALTKTKGEFKYEVVIGGRVNSVASPNPHQKVNCGGSLTTLQNNSTETEYWICQDDQWSNVK